MHKLKQIFTFIAPYLKPYWGRLLAGLFFGVLFGVSNGLVLWATKLLLDRLDPQTVDAVVGANAQVAGNWFTGAAATIQTNVLSVLDPWLPRMGDELTWMQICLLYTSPSPRDRG